MIKKTALFLLFFSYIPFVIAQQSQNKNDNIINIVSIEAHFFNESGDKVFLDQFQGKNTLLVFWATWCVECLKNLQSLDILKKDFQKVPIEIVPISEDFQGIDSVKAYFKNNDIRHLKIYYDNGNSLFKELGVVGIPTSFLIDINGNVVLQFTKPVPWHDDNIRKQILDKMPGSYPLPQNSYKSKFVLKPNTTTKHRGRNNNDSQN